MALNEIFYGFFGAITVLIVLLSEARTFSGNFENQQKRKIQNSPAVFSQKFISSVSLFCWTFLSRKIDFLNWKILKSTLKTHSLRVKQIIKTRKRVTCHSGHPKLLFSLSPYQKSIIKIPRKNFRSTKISLYPK